MSRSRRRLSLGPLEDYLLYATRRRGWVERHGDNCDPMLLSVPEIVEHLGVTARSWQRYRGDDSLPIERAEAIADRFGVHPIEVWGDEWVFIAACRQPIEAWGDLYADLLWCHGIDVDSVDWTDYFEQEVLDARTW